MYLGQVRISTDKRIKDIVKDIISGLTFNRIRLLENINIEKRLN